MEPQISRGQNLFSNLSLFMDTKEMRFMYTYLLLKGKQAGEGLKMTPPGSQAKNSITFLSEA